MRSVVRGGVAICLLGLAACGSSGEFASFVGAEAKVVLLGSEVFADQELYYEAIDLKQGRMDTELGDARVDEDALSELLLRLHPEAFARIAHLTDAQIREQRAVLIGEGTTDALESLSDVAPAGEGSQRGELQEADSPFTWAAVCQTVNWIDAQPNNEYRIDFAVHTGDAVDVGLRSELAHFVYGAYRLDVPFLVAAGNHDISTFGLWREGFTFNGLPLDTVIDDDEVDPVVFDGNQETLIQGRENFARQFRALVDADSAFAQTATSVALASDYFGLDSAHPLSPPLEENRLYYTHEILAPAPQDGTPGLQVIVLETNIDDGSFEAEMDPQQLQWLGNVLDDARTRQNLVVLSAHHPPMKVSREDDNRGTISEVVVPPAMVQVRRMCSHYPNVVLFLCGHTHKPQICEWRDTFTDTDVSHGSGVDPGRIEWIQIDAGSILVAPQESGIVELVFDGDDILIHNNRFGAMIDEASQLGQRVRAARASALGDEQSAPRYIPDRTYVGVLLERLDVFRDGAGAWQGVDVPRYDPSAP